MSAVYLLLRHAAHDNVGGFLAGRLPGVTLGPEGLAQAERLALRMRRERLDAIHASPRERTLQTAEAVARQTGIAGVTIEPGLDEIDFGADWQGRDFLTLHQDPRWQRWNAQRGLARTAGGETMREVAVRAMAVLEKLLPAAGERRIALVSHADVIKVVVAEVLGLGLDAVARFDIAPASVTSLVMGEWGAKLITLNETVD